MADKKISELPAATLPLAGTEEMVVIQGGISKRVPSLDVKDAIRDAENLGMQVVEVFLITDLPPESGGKIVLVDMTLYLWKAPISTPHKLVIPVASTIGLSAINRLFNIHTYTGSGPAIENATATKAKRIDLINIIIESTGATGTPFILDATDVILLQNMQALSAKNMPILLCDAVITKNGVAMVGNNGDGVSVDCLVFQDNHSRYLITGTPTSDTLRIVGTRLTFASLGSSSIATSGTNSTFNFAPTITASAVINIISCTSPGLGSAYGAGSMTNSDPRVNTLNSPFAGNSSALLSASWFNNAVATTVSSSVYGAFDLGNVNIDSFSQKLTVVDPVVGRIRNDSLKASLFKFTGVISIIPGSGTQNYFLKLSKNNVFPQIDGSVTSITRAGSTATATTSGNHNLETEAFVEISGAVQTEYNGQFSIIVLTPTTFTYQVAGTPVTPATGTIIQNVINDIVQVQTKTENILVSFSLDVFLDVNEEVQISQGGNGSTTSFTTDSGDITLEEI